MSASRGKPTSSRRQGRTVFLGALGALALFAFSLTGVTLNPAAAAPALPAIAPGTNHACGVDVTGELYCWGYNFYGQLGDGTSTDRPTPVKANVAGLPPGTSFAAVASGAAHSCALSTAGSIYCWGLNNFGQLGVGTASWRSVPTPIQVSALPVGISFKSVTAGLYHSCAVSTAGDVYCWGWNASGQLGDASTTQRTSPNSISTAGLPVGTEFVGVTAGNQQHTCAVTDGGAVYCWGDNASGQLGDGTTTQRTSPVAVVMSGLPAGSAFSSVDAGGGHSCGLTTSGKAYCWGQNVFGFLGDGTTTARPIPTAVDISGLPAGTVWTALGAGGQHTCGVAASGVAYCWGRNNVGQLGNGGTNQRLLPTPVSSSALPGGTVLTDVATDTDFSCAIADSGRAYCWGSNQLGQLGNGTTTWQLTPAPLDQSGLPLGATFAEVDSDFHHSCAVSGAGALYCWGLNPDGRVGDGTQIDRAKPTAVDTSGLPAGTSFASVATGYRHSCGLSTFGSLYCWGSNSDGQLGDGTTTDRLTPVAVVVTGLPAGTTFSAIAAGQFQTCALTTSGTAYCWGGGGQAVIGDGTTFRRQLPTAVDVSALPVGTTFTDISAGAFHTCAVSAAGAAYCWGSNPFGEVGDGTTTTRTRPVAVATGGLPGGTQFSRIAAGGSHSCAVAASSGAAYCWGRNLNGQVGDGTTTQRTSPAAVSASALPAGTSFSSIATGLAHSCAVTTTGSAYCWGTNGDGRLGDGTSSQRTSPTAVQSGQVPPGTELNRIVAGWSGSCALESPGGAYCWGYNDTGELGVGRVLTPAQVVGFPTVVEPIYVLPGDNGALSGVMEALAAEIPQLEILARNQSAGTFSRPGCSTSSSPLPASDSDLVAAALEQFYLDVFGQSAGPLSPDCAPDVVTIYGP